MSLRDLTIKEISSKLRQKELTATDLVKLSFRRIGEVERDVQAFITLDEQNALADAAALDSRIAAGKSVGILAGLPVGIKDNISTKGILTTCGSKMLANYLPVYNATAYEKIVAGFINQCWLIHGNSMFYH